MIVFSGIDISIITALTTTEDISSIPTELPDFWKLNVLIISAGCYPEWTYYWGSFL